MITIIEIDPGNVVLCDFCNEDYTFSNEQGGLLFGSKGVCPKCAPKLEKDAMKYDESHFIYDRARKSESFRDFIYRIRK